MIPLTASLEKVTCFIHRQHHDIDEILLIRHPYAGYQFPAGTVEPGESTEQAALREAQEETGIRSGLEIVRKLHQTGESFPGKSVLIQSTTAYARPDPSSWSWLSLPRAIWLTVLQNINGYTQIQFNEPDRSPDSSYITFAFTAWVPSRLLSHEQYRTFYLMACTSATPASWEVFTDHHTFIADWFPLDALPRLIQSTQSTWLPVLNEAIKFL